MIWICCAVSLGYWHTAFETRRYERTTALIGNTYFKTIVFTTAQKWPLWDTQWAIESARRLEMQRNLFAVVHLCSPVVLSYLVAGFEPRCRRKDFSNACLLMLACCCCLLLLLKCVAHAWTLKGGVKPRQGKPTSVIKTHD